MSPVWEANHVWLIFVLVITWTAFPVAFGAIFETLAVPLFLAALGIILRGTAFALRGQAATIAEARFLGARVRVLLGAAAVLPRRRARAGSPSGRVDVERPVGVDDAWTNPTSIAIGVLAVLTGAYLAAVYMAGDATRAGAARTSCARSAPARSASGAVTGVAAIGALLVIRSDARPLFDGLTSGSAAGRRDRLGDRRPGHVRAGLDRALRARTGDGRRRGRRDDRRLVAGDAARPAAGPHDRRGGGRRTRRSPRWWSASRSGCCILIPSLFYLYRLVLRGTLDQGYEPLDQRFKPLSAGDEEPQ